MKTNVRKSGVIALFLIFSMLLCSCGEYKPPAGSVNNGGSSGNTNDIVLPDDVTDEMFTVSLYHNGKKYVPAQDEVIYVQWTDGFSVYSEKLGLDGFARVSGLDGDYRVTLSTVPESYSYNPNAYVATNDSKHVAIELLDVTEVETGATGLYSAINLTQSGIYRVQLNSADDIVYFQFVPQSSGTYSVESWADTVANSVNPQADIYKGTIGFKYFSHTLDDGGAESSYTKNFKYEVSVDSTEIGNVYTFVLRVYSRDGTYPQTVDFALTLDGEFSRDWTVAKFVYPEENLSEIEIREYSDKEYRIVTAEKHEGGAAILDSNMYKLWKREEGGDGFYHLYNPDAYAETGGYGPILYAYVTSACKYIDRSLTTIEYAGNKALTVSGGSENYKIFIEGYKGILGMEGSYYFCVSDCPCRLSEACEGACLVGCSSCSGDCRNIEPVAKDMLGYADICNSDGLCPVTQEMRDFLQKYSVTQMLFFDGNGFVEKSGVYALEEDQWLFACAYYVEK